MPSFANWTGSTPKGNQLPVRVEYSTISCINIREGNYEPFSHSDVCRGNNRCSGLDIGISLALPGP
jgi:hypothetical protein